MSGSDGSVEGLVLKNVSAGYGETVVLNQLSLAVAPKATLAVLGRNGVGKTTLVATIMGYTRLHGGAISYMGQDISRLPIYQRAELGVALVPQEREIFRSLTVTENLVVGQRPGRWTLERVFEFFPSLAARRQNRGDQLSGGEQQMLAFGRALLCNPTLLMMDEPLEGLAPVIVDQLFAGLERLKKEDAMTLLLIEQHAALALAFAETAIVLDRGEIVYQGPSVDLSGDPTLMAQLLGIGRRADAPVQ